MRHHIFQVYDIISMLCAILSSIVLIKALETNLYLSIIITVLLTYVFIIYL